MFSWWWNKQPGKKLKSRYLWLQGKTHIEKGETGSKQTAQSSEVNACLGKYCIILASFIMSSSRGLNREETGEVDKECIVIAKDNFYRDGNAHVVNRDTHRA